MLGQLTCNRFLWSYSTWGTASATPGTSVQPGVNGNEGAWYALVTAANLTQDVYGILLNVGAGAASSYERQELLDIGVDPAGGTSYSPVISNIVCGQSPPASTALVSFYFPFFIKAGSQIGVRVQASDNAGAMRVPAIVYGRPSRPELIRAGQFSETVGTITGTLGVGFTPGQNTLGNWQLLGTTVNALWWWQLGVQVNNGGVAAQYTAVDLAYGDGTNMVPIITNRRTAFYGSAEICATPGANHLFEGFCEVPAGSNIYIRGRCNTAPAAGYNAAAIGIGG